MKYLITWLLVYGLAGCAFDPDSADWEEREPEILTVYEDGTMEFRGRPISEEEVVLYPDGSGGERAAVRVRVPLKLDSLQREYYYRDTIKVKRK